MANVGSQIRPTESKGLSPEDKLHRALFGSTPLDSDGQMVLIRGSCEGWLDVISRVLTEREATVIRARFGLITGVSESLERIANQFQVTKERVRQIQTEALSKLRDYTMSLRRDAFKSNNEFNEKLVYTSNGDRYRGLWHFKRQSTAERYARFVSRGRGRPDTKVVRVDILQSEYVVFEKEEPVTGTISAGKLIAQNG